MPTLLTFRLKIIRWEGEDGKKEPKVVATHIQAAQSFDLAVNKVADEYCGGRAGYVPRYLKDGCPYVSREGWE